MRSTMAAMVIGAGLTACGASNGKLKECEVRDALVAQQIATFDDLDYNVFSNQKWDQLKNSHAQDIVVHWPDGHTTTGLDRHIADLKLLFMYAPDTRIKEHPIKLGNGEWTAVQGIMQGTFTQPMLLPTGKSIPPTGKAFKLAMVTLGHWNKAGVMSEEYLLWDSGELMKQLGLAPE